MCPGGLSLTIDRAQVIDFSMAIRNSLISLIVPNSKYYSNDNGASYLDFYSYLHVFSMPVWIVLAILSIIFSLCLALSFDYNIERRFYSYLKFLVQYGLALLQMAPSAKRINLSCNCMHCLMSLYGMIIFITYTCDMTAEMTTGEQDNIPETFLGIIDQNYEIYVRGGALTEAILRQAPDGSELKTVYDNNVRVYQYPSDGNNAAILTEVLSKPKRAFFGSVEEYVDDDRFDIFRGFEDKIQDSVHLGYQRNSDLTEFFDFHLAKLIQSGTVDNLIQKWLDQDKPEFDMTRRIFMEDVRPLGSKNLVFPCLIVLASTVIAFLILVFELFRNKVKKHNIQHTY